ncbi:hypothetical protein FHT72_006967 [Rhizobium sp. BK077]|nr:hypothetical protein [Rhizobium sp. BK112]MBB3372428.1 hypothetical protein [Rhizobium sp. BK077]MBB4183167.1 hypothetical protein [Rhizobium sp. BK109]
MSGSAKRWWLPEDIAAKIPIAVTKKLDLASNRGRDPLVEQVAVVIHVGQPSEELDVNSISEALLGSGQVQRRLPLFGAVAVVVPFETLANLLRKYPSLRVEDDSSGDLEQ